VRPFLQISKPEDRNMDEAQATAPRGIRKHLPILNWLPNYPARWLRADLLAGLVAAAVVIPQAMAYASIAGLPVQVGLYVALAPMLVYERMFFNLEQAVEAFSAQK
jgi:MFS superfamily sulfate permease-like transporter